MDEAELLLGPVADELVAARPIGFEPLRWMRALAAGEPVPTSVQLTSSAVSAPGVLLTQIAAIGLILLASIGSAWRSSRSLGS